MSQTPRTCYHCSGQLALSTQTKCPHCGVPVADAHENTDAVGGWLGETMVTSEMSTPGPPQPAGDAIGESLVGQQLDVYKIQRLLGRGGMAWVFLAEHANLHRLCALKVLCPEFQGRQADSIEMFLAEARSAASVVHPHIVTVHNVGSADDKHFIELEFVNGSSMDEVLGDEDLDEFKIIRLMTQATSALAAAHEQGLVHRDFKPANIMVGGNGMAKLADFGLAKQLDDVRGRASIAGTPYYMAPELFRGEPATAASDVYAFGISLYRLLAAGYPYQHADWTELARLHAEADLPNLLDRLPRLDAAAAELVGECMAKDPHERPRDGNVVFERMQSIYRSMRDLRALIENAFEGNDDVSWKMVGNAFELRVQLPGDRQQRVTIEEGETEISPTPLVRIFTVCSPVRADYMRRALELNAQMPHGALSIQEMSGEEFFVMVNNYPRSTCDVEEVRHSVLDLARWGDAVEQALSGEDRY